VVAVLAVFLTLQAYQQTAAKRLVIVGPAGIGDLGKALALEFSRRHGVNATFVALGGAVEMANELVRNRDNPPRDVAWVPEFYYTVLIESFSNTVNEGERAGLWRRPTPRRQGSTVASIYVHVAFIRLDETGHYAE